MKKILIILCCLVFNRSFSQSSFSDTIKISDLAPPSSPAFVLLDAAPSSIERPTTAKAFTASVINLINNNGGAAEFTPYWLLPRKRMTSFRYLGIDPTRQNHQNVFSYVKLLSVSLAVLNRNNTEETSTKPVSNIALGFRTKLLQKNKQSSIDTLVKYHKIIADSLRNLDNKAADIAFEFKSLIEQATTEEAKANLIKQRNNKIREIQLVNSKNIKIYSDIVSKSLTEKPIFSVDLAAAANYAFDSTRLNSGGIGRLGIWSNIDWVPLRNDKKNHYFHTIGVVRYITNDKLLINKDVTENHNYFDYGIKIEAEFKRFSIGFEYIERNVLTDKALNSNRSAGVLNYRVADNVFIAGTFGKNFGKDDSLITLFGIQFNFSNEKVIIN